MKYLLFILFSAVTFAQTYDVGQTNANVAKALSDALSYPDSNYLKTSEVGSVVQAYDADLTTLGAGGSSARSFLGLAIGTNVQAYDADLTTYAGITPSANVQTFLGYADFAAMRTGLGLVIGTNVQAYDADLTSWGAITPAIYYDTLSVSFGVMDTVTTGDYPGWKVPNNITVTEVAAYTNTGTVTFNLEERAETTPNTAGTDLIGSDLVADDDQQETGTFSNATLDRNDWLVMNVTSITGDPTIFSVTIRYIKTD